MITEALLFAQIGTNIIAEYNIESQLPNMRNMENAYPSGLDFKDEGFVKYGPPSIDDPILFIVDPIFDKDYNYIPPGPYQLTLDPGREVMYLIQSGKVLAIIPVFKVEIDKKKDAQKRKDLPPKGFWKMKKYQIKKHFKDRRHKQNVKKKRIEDKKKIYSDATIELVPGERYFLIKYEKEAVKAWGALKFR